jgi:lipopolysaccharide export LptBFGC system permease protein LptF
MELRFHLFADEVRYENGSWIASVGWFRQIYPDGTDEFREISAPLEVGIPESPAYFGQEYRQPAEMSHGQLRAYINELRDSGYRPVRLVVRWHQKLAYPLTAFIMVFLALPFGLNLGGRRVSAMQGIAIALGLGIGFYLLNMGLGKMGEAELLPPVVGAWAPTVLAVLFAINRSTTLRT